MLIESVVMKVNSKLVSRLHRVLSYFYQSAMQVPLHGQKSHLEKMIAALQKGGAGGNDRAGSNHQPQPVVEGEVV